MARSRTLFDRHGAIAEWVDDELVWSRPGAFEEPEETGPQVMRDLAPYRSMIDGSVIDGRKRHRDHLKAHGCIEVGNEQMKSAPQAPSSPSRRESLHRMLADVGDRDISRMIKTELRNRQ